jgi:hypothetical protein
MASPLGIGISLGDPDNVLCEPGHFMGNGGVESERSIQLKNICCIKLDSLGTIMSDERTV